MYVQGASKHIGCPLNVWTLPYVWMPPYVWKMFGCPLYICNTKKACFVTLRGAHMPHTFGCPICFDGPYMFECLHMCGHPLYVWMPPMFRCYLYVWTPLYVWMPHMFEHPLYVWIMFGYPHTYTTHRKHALSH